jgi:hypothetical protein
MVFHAVGRVVGTAMQKTAKVAVTRTVQHPKYHKVFVHNWQFWDAGCVVKQARIETIMLSFLSDEERRAVLCDLFNA